MKVLVVIFVLFTIFHQTTQRNFLRKLLRDAYDIDDVQDVYDMESIEAPMHSTYMFYTSIKPKVTSYYCPIKIGLRTGGSTVSIGKKDTPKECFHACVGSKESLMPDINQMELEIKSKQCYCVRKATGITTKNREYQVCYIKTVG